METIINQPMPAPTPKSKTWLWLIIIILVALLAGAGVYYWQNMEAKKMASVSEEKIRNEMQVKITEAENRAVNLNNKLSEAEKKITELEENQTNNILCTAAPTPSAIGNDDYPIDSKYQDLRYLGQLFTASDCTDQTRITKIIGVSGEDYTLGSNLSLRNDPSAELIKELKNIGFSCSSKISENNCRQWTLKKPVKVIDILKLKSFYQELQGSDCINCG